MLPYTFIWQPDDDSDPTAVPLWDVSPRHVLDAAADLDMDCDLFTDLFLYRLLYSLTYQLWHGKAAAAFGLPDGGTVTVRRATL